MNSPYWVYLVGLGAQALFTARVLVQWFLSEKHHRVMAPDIYWVLSICAACIFFVYGYLRHDLSIIIGEVISYYVYLWNIRVRGLLDKLPYLLKLLISLVPVFAVGVMLLDAPQFAQIFLLDRDLPLALLALGISGQILYNSRYICQLVYGLRHNASVLPPIFWIVSVLGSLIIILYGCLRHDWVLVIGEVGIVASIRNLMIAYSDVRES